MAAGKAQLPKKNTENTTPQKSKAKKVNYSGPSWVRSSFQSQHVHASLCRGYWIIIPNLKIGTMKDRQSWAIAAKNKYEAAMPSLLLRSCIVPVLQDKLISCRTYSQE